MIKDKEWLKEEIKKLITEESQYMPHGEMVDLGLVLLTIDQLDEPEKPVIPQFVADCIEEERAKIIDWHTEIPERFFLILGYKIHYTTLANANVSDWVFSGNEEKLYQALKYGYEVEKEKKYYVLDNKKRTLLWKYPNQVNNSGGYELETVKRKEAYTLTEKEIKDYDERFWQFAVPVEEEAE